MGSKQLFLFFSLLILGCANPSVPLYEGLKENMFATEVDTILAERLVYHPIRLDDQGYILPWYSDNLGQSYDHVLDRVWNFWKDIELDANGMKYYLNHQVWAPEHDKRGLGGDQLNMALSSWDLYYNYTGDESVIENMKYMADYYLAHSLSPATADWAHIPYPYNMNVESGIYDGDMILGKGYTQPDKAGSFGFELLHLYKKTGIQKYLDAAVMIANTLALKVQPGDHEHSPWPFKVNAATGEVGVLVDREVWYEGMDKDLDKTTSRHTKSSYTTFFTGTLNLFKELIAMRKGNTSEYQKAFDIALEWFKSYPVKTNKWGPFFEDVPRWSDTQINAVTYAMFIMENPSLDPQWKPNVKGILDWVYKELGNHSYAQYGVVVIDEQTAYRVPGNSHTARQASIDLMYWEKSGDSTYVRNAVRQLNWATYMVDSDGKNFYPTNAIWMTDGYGDYVRHYLRAMASAPQLAPDDEDHVLRTSSIISKIKYRPDGIFYTTFDDGSQEIFRLTSKPSVIKANGKELNEVTTGEGWTWQSLEKGGILILSHAQGNNIEIIK